MNPKWHKSAATEKHFILEEQLKRIITQEDLSARKALIEVSARHLKLDYLDVAAALLCLLEPAPELSESDQQRLNQEKQKAFQLLNAQMVRYRIEVGRVDKASVNVIKEILIEVAGVESSKIGYIDVFDHYSVLSLPPGMPVDILQTLKETELNHKLLDIKRLSGAGKKCRPEKNVRRGTRRHLLAHKKNTLSNKAS